MQEKISHKCDIINSRSISTDFLFCFFLIFDRKKNIVYDFMFSFYMPIAYVFFRRPAVTHGDQAESRPPLRMLGRRLEHERSHRKKLKAKFSKFKTYGDFKYLFQLDGVFPVTLGKTRGFAPVIVEIWELIFVCFFHIRENYTSTNIFHTTN